MGVMKNLKEATIAVEHTRDRLEQAHLAWGHRLDRWHDERGPLHLLRDDNSPACGARYYAMAGATPDPAGHAKCRTCERIALAHAKN